MSYFRCDLELVLKMFIQARGWDGHPRLPELRDNGRHTEDSYIGPKKKVMHTLLVKL